MRPAFRVALSLLAAAGGGACEKEPEPFVCNVKAPTECSQPDIAWADVAPIFENRCSSCHTGKSGDPWPLDTYEHVTDWYDVVRDELITCEMPPHDAPEQLSPKEREDILVWLRCGFPE